MSTEVAELIFEADSSALVAANDQLEHLNRTGARTDGVLRRMRNSFRVHAGATQNAAYQIQDFAVQVAGGTSAMRAFNQQAPQLLSIFGPGGAVLGGIIAVSGAIAGPFIASLFESQSATDTLEESLKKLSDTVKKTKDGTILLSEEFEILAAKSRDMAEVQLKARLIEAATATTAAMAKLREESEAFNVTLGRSGNAARGNATVLKRAAAELGITASELGELQRLSDRAFSTESQSDIDAFQKRVNELALTSGTATDKFINLAQSVNTAFLSLKQGQDITEQLRSALNDLDTALATSGEKTTERLKKQAEDRAKELERIYETEERLTKFFAKENAKREELEKKSAERRAAINLATNQAVLSAQTDFFSQLGAILQQGNDNNSAVAKAGYLMVQGVQVAQAINNANLAYSGMIAAAASAASMSGLAAPAVFAAGQAQAEFVRGLGYATAGLIAGNAVGTVAARAQGGQVRPGQAYRVGEFGPETLVMGSNGGTITNAANDGANINLTTNVKVLGGNSNAQVSNTTRQVSDRKFVQDIVVDLMANQSSPARNALHKTSNVKPVGQR